MSSMSSIYKNTCKCGCYETVIYREKILCDLHKLEEVRQNNILLKKEIERLNGIIISNESLIRLIEKNMKFYNS